MTDDDDGWCAFAEIAGFEEASGVWFDAQRGEQVRCRAQPLDADRFVAIEQRRLDVGERHEHLERLLALTQVDHVAQGHIVLGDTRAQIAMPEHHHALRVSEGKRSEQDGFDDSEEGGVGAYAERQGQDGGGAEGRLTPEQPQCLAEIAKNHRDVLPSRLVRWRHTPSLPAARDK